ncbi:Uu.00g051670.m01.CDS01 [Anthostomella pinea]|uniref:Uu.00g051670.m01.CDS01 n=1 Tax=Anthostomella pinea TaxID=933095 RepID=A0AAI8YLZ0_9PEZI|nr:Uu.00g051670.m01.CDS01 [Anthostomella pinea]
MATDSLTNLIANVPDWLKRLDDLNGQIEQRQQDLAKLPENQLHSSARSTKSIRNRGSTESLKPVDEGAAFPNPNPLRVTTPPPNTQNVPPQPVDGPQPPSTPGSDPRTGSSLLRQTHEVRDTAQRRARATLRKRQKTDSMLSGEVPSIPKYRTRRMIIVYYDSYVQSFFEELVKFVSAQRNVLRKAKMAAKVARIKRLAELEMPDDDDDDDAGELKPGDALIAADPKASASPPTEASPEELKLRYMGARQMRPGYRNPALAMMHMRRPGALNGGLGMFNEKGDVWDDLDKSLEFVQGMCEHAAHQFLRDGDCSDEINKIKSRLAEVKIAADKETDRADAEKPTCKVTDASEAGSVPEPVRSRSYRPMVMRRELTGASTPTKAATKEGVMEVDDEGVHDMGDFTCS